MSWQAALKQRMDSWYNALTGLGGMRDKRSYSEVSPVEEIQQDELRALYDGDDLAAIICEALPEDSMRVGFELEDDDDPDGERRDDVMDLLNEVHARDRLLDALIYGRVFGGGALLIGAEDGQDFAEPLVVERVRELRYLTVLERSDLSPLTWNADPRSPGFGRPEVYQVAASSGGGSSMFTVHSSRLILTDGARTPPRSMPSKRGWSYSVLQRSQPALRDFQSAMDAAGLMFQDGSQAVYYLHGLIDMMAMPGGKAAIAERMELVDLGRSVARALVLDAEKERFEIHDRTFAGVRDVLDFKARRLTATAQMPLTRLFGMSPGGMNATGESDLEGWYGHVEAYRKHEVEPCLDRLVEIACASLGIDSTMHVVWPNLWVEGPKQLAERSKLVADTDAVYIDRDVYTPDEVAAARAQGPEAPVVVDLEARAAIESEPEIPEDDIYGAPPTPPQFMPQADPPEEDE